MPSRRPVVTALALLIALGAAGPAAADVPNGLQADVFDAQDLTGAPVVTRIDPTVDFDWGESEPVPGVGDTFSVRWTGTVTAPKDGRFTFVTRTDDGVRLWVDGDLVIDDWTMHAQAERSGDVDLEAGKPVSLKMEYFDGRRVAVARLLWKRPGGVPAVVVPTTALTPPGDPSSVPPAPEQTPDPAQLEKVKELVPATETLTQPVEAPADVPAVTVPGVPESTDVPVEVAPLLPPPVPPVAGETFNAAPESGEVLVRRPEDGALIPLQEGASLPVGTRLDSRNGAVEIETAPGVGFTGAVQHARFSGATFKVGQPRGKGRVVSIDLQHGDFESCDAAPRSRPKSRTTARAAARSKRVRAIFGSGKGRFRTKGRHAAATVRGTVWSIEDRCDATVTTVREGVVDVEDFTNGRTVAVRAGRSYTARP